MCDIETAKAIYKDGYICVLVKNGIAFASKERGISPLIELAEEGDWHDFAVADKIVGKAAALLYVFMRAKEVHAEVLSFAAERVLREHGIKVSCDSKTEKIMNRKGDGICPMEQAVADIEDPVLALATLKRKVEELKK